jgi:DNA polymerase-3 subunit epsilon
VEVLPRGGVVDLPVEERTWSVTVGWPRFGNPAVDVDVVASLTDGSDEVRADSDFVFYNAPLAPSGAVELTLGRSDESVVEVRLDQVPIDVESITIAASLPPGHTFGSVGGVHLMVRNRAGVPHLRSVLDSATTEQSLLLARIYRRGGRWRFRAVGQGYEFGLGELAVKFGVEVD